MSRFDSDLGPFAVVPLRLIVAGVSDRAVRVFALLASKYADKDGKAFPSRAKIGIDLGASVDSVDRAITELVDSGFVVVSRRQGPKGDWTSNEYRLRYANDPDATGGSRSLAATGTDAATLAAPERSPSRSRAATGVAAPVPTQEHLAGTTELDPLNQMSLIQARFAEFRSAWPKGFWTGHEAALRVWEDLAPDAELHAVIMASLDDHKAHHPKWRPDRRGEVYIPNPRTWLNQARWKDDVHGPVPAGRANDWRARPASTARPEVRESDIDRVLADPALVALVRVDVEQTLAPYKGRWTDEQMEAARARGLRSIAERFVSRLAKE